MEKRVHDNVMSCQRIIGKSLTPDEVRQIRGMVSSVMKQERKNNFRKQKTGEESA